MAGESIALNAVATATPTMENIQNVHNYMHWYITLTCIVRSHFTQVHARKMLETKIMSLITCILLTNTHARARAHTHTHTHTHTPGSARR